jgi:hypothetical protein
MKFLISIMTEEKYEIKEIVVEKPKIKYLMSSEVEELVKSILFEKGLIGLKDIVNVDYGEWLGGPEKHFSYHFEVFKKAFEGQVYGITLSQKGEDIKKMVIQLKLPKEKETLEKVS